MGDDSCLKPAKIEIKKFEENGKNRLGAVFDLVDFSPTIKDNLSIIEKDYSKMIEEVKQIEFDNRYKKRMAYRRWLISRVIFMFFEKSLKRDFYLKRRLEGLVRDTGFSRTEIKYLLKFYRFFPEKQMVDEEIPWSVYRALLDRPNEEERARLYQLVKSRRSVKEKEVRNFTTVKKNKKRPQ